MSKNKERKVRKKADIPEGETKEHRFIRVVTPRVKNVLHGVAMIKLMITSGNYSMTQEQINTITETIGKEVLSMNDCFQSRNKRKGREEISFSL